MWSMILRGLQRKQEKTMGGQVFGQTLNLPRCTTIVAVFVLLSMLGGSVQPSMNLPIMAIDTWATKFGESIDAIATKATALRDLQQAYLLMEPRVRPISGSRMLRTMKMNMENMLSKKVKAIRKLVKVAEDAYAAHEYDKHLKVNANFSYPKAKKLNTSEFLLDENEHFNFIPVNLNDSTVHVPTNVYDESVEVLNGVKWSEALDPVFFENYEEDPTLTWQYFGSAEGFFRDYPGFEWKSDGVDMFDCRTRGWYIQAATSPKDVVIMLDTSGSMTGLRMEIAKATIRKILDTLSDDDFFNVIKFSSFPEYVDECFNGTMVQANADNKKRIKEALGNIVTQDIAYFDKALIEAFELLRSVNYTGKAAQCNRAIMLVTDGAPNEYEEIFRTYNWPDKNVRIFSFLIGREVSFNKQLHWMACNNKGYYSHISTLADVHEHVQDYIHVLSRPMVIQRVSHTVWTNVYVDAAGLKLMTSVAAPVFDTKNDSLNEGNLLGVMGTDVPLKELTKITPQYKLGVNGYAFAITNNGYILFHPDFRPTEGDIVKPNYNSVDLAEVELSDKDKFLDSSSILSPDYDNELRTKMVDRETGHLKMTVKIHYDNMKRVTLRTNNYFFTDIEDTPFSLGIALPEDYGMNELDGYRSLNEADLSAIKASDVKIASWNYCDMDTNETRQDPVEMLIKFINFGLNKETKAMYDKKCDKDLIESFLFDAMATRGAKSDWIKENRDGTPNDKTSKKNGIELVFLGTKGGLTRYHVLTENLTDPTFIDENSETIEELYYKRAVQGGENIFTFSIPYFADEDCDFNRSVITASTPIIIDDNRHTAVAAVVGLQMRYDKFYELFMNSTRVCPPVYNQESPNKLCNITCESHELDCYLLDENGYVILSENEGEIGQFFGELDGTLMLELMIKDDDQDPYLRGGAKKGVFKKVPVYDYQGICEIWRKGSSSARSMFVDPIRRLFSSVTWLMTEIVLFLIQFNIVSWWHGDYTPVRGVYGETDIESYINMLMIKLGKHGSEEQVYKWKNSLLKGPLDYTNITTVNEWYENLLAEIGPRFEGYEPCFKELPLYMASPQKLPVYGWLQNCSLCSRAYSIHRVARTNLMLLAVDAQCYCIMDMPIKVEPKEVKYNDTMMCQRLQQEIYRRRPGECYAYHPDEDSTKCSDDARVLQPSQVLLLCAVLLASWLQVTPAIEAASFSAQSSHRCRR